MRVGIEGHPNWYQGLTADSSFYDVQAFLARHRRNTTCPLPCPVAAARARPPSTSARPTASSTGTATRTGSQPSTSWSRTADGQPCRAVVAGEPCQREVQWAMLFGIKEHPDWYQGLSKDSSVDEMQAFLSKHRASAACPLPCSLAGPTTRLPSTSSLPSTSWKKAVNGPACRTVNVGELCQQAVWWAMHIGISEHPDWYPGLAEDSSLDDVQAFLSEHRRDSTCPKPCSPALPNTTIASTTPVPRASWGKTMDGQPCRTVLRGELCYRAVKWAMHIGIRGHPDWYQGLTTNSSFEDVQVFLSKHRRNTTCPPPCTPVRTTMHSPSTTTTIPPSSTSQGKRADGQLCRKVLPGEPCHREVSWVRSIGISQHPEWYYNLPADASFEDVQYFLARHQKDTSCRLPCGLATTTPRLPSASTGAGQACRTVTKGDPCYTAVEWAMHVGLKLHPSWYGSLTSASGFEAFQALLAKSGEGSRQCPPPCHNLAPSSPAPSAMPSVTHAEPGVEDAGNSSETPQTTVTSTTAPSQATLRTEHLAVFYAYRAQSDATYPLENVNAADLGGVLWYLQNEVLTMCPRKYGITRVLRFRITTRRPFVAYMAFDSARCSVPGCPEYLKRHGYRVGCQTLRHYGSRHAHWLSLPGPCASANISAKTPSCKLQEPGGACRTLTQLIAPFPASSTCSYYAELAGEVRLDSITGIENYTAFCETGGLEYNHTRAAGERMDFWDGIHDQANNTRRVREFQAAFGAAYPELPPTLGDLKCVDNESP